MLIYRKTINKEIKNQKEEGEEKAIKRNREIGEGKEEKQRVMEKNCKTINKRECGLLKDTQNMAKSIWTSEHDTNM